MTNETFYHALGLAVFWMASAVAALLAMYMLGHWLRGIFSEWSYSRHEAYIERLLRSELLNCARWFSESKEASAAFDAVAETVCGERMRPSDARDKWREAIKPKP